MNSNKALSLLYLANGISGFAQGVSMLAIPWYFASKQESGYFNTGYGLSTILVLLFGLYAGSLVDKYSRKNNFLVTSLVCGLLVGSIAVFGYVFSGVSDFFVMAVFTITMLNYNIHYPTLYALGQELASPEHYHKVNARIEIVGQSVSILSGGLAALLLEGVPEGKSMLFGMEVDMPFAIPKWEIQDVFLMDAGTYLIAAFLIYTIRYEPAVYANRHQGSVLERIRSGFEYLRNQKSILVFGIFSYIVFAMLLVEIHAVLPGYVERHLEESGSVFALADGIYAVGALAAGLFIGKLFRTQQTVMAVVVLTGTTALIFLWAFATKSVWVIYSVSLILGFTNAGIRVLRLTYLFHHIPNELMGRVGSVFNMTNVLIRTFFIFLFSQTLFAESNRIVWAYFIMAGVLLISTGVLLLNYKNLHRENAT